MDYGFGNYAFYCDEAEDMGEMILQVRSSVIKELELYVKDDFQKLLSKEQKGKVERKIEYPQEMDAPVLKGQIVGYVRYFLDGKEIGKTPICAKETAKRYSYAQLLKITIKKLAIF